MHAIRLAARLTAATAVALALVGLGTAWASPYAKGPDPTADTLRALSGPYEVDVARIPNSASPLFGPATAFAPRAPAGTSFGAIAVSPGFLAEQWTLTWLARRLATHGFVTIVFTPNNVTVRPPARSVALLAALDHVTNESAFAGRVDPDRRAVIGHSMGGGGALEAARREHGLKAAVAIAPWSTRKGFGEITSPTLVIGHRPDWIAPVASHARPFYASLQPSLPKAYLELDLDHAASSLFPITDISRSAVNWFKRFLDDDERYTAAICPAMAGTQPGRVTAWRSSCGEGPLATTPATARTPAR